MSALELLARAGHLFALAVAPRLPSPEPLRPGDTLDVALGALALLGGPLAAAAMAWRIPTREAWAAVAAWVVASAGLVYGASSAPPHTTLLASYYVAAPLLWLALSLTAATLGGRYLGSSFRNRRLGPALITVAVGVFVFRDAHTFIASPTQQWEEVLARDPAHERAFFEIRPALAADPQRFSAALSACLDRDPGACICRLERAESHLYQRDPKAALSELTSARCGASLRVARVRGVALAMSAPPGEAEPVVMEALASFPDDPALLTARALVLDRGGRAAEALEVVEKAVELGAGYDAKLLLSALLISAGDLARAKIVLEALAREHPLSADVAYNLALVADREGQYNPAREGYLRALKLRPDLPNARYNLAMLTLRHGVLEEAKSHARRFRERWPDDPRVAPVAAAVGLQD